MTERGRAVPGSVAASELGTQPVGEVAEIAEGVYQLKLPVPLPLVFVSVYLVRGDHGWTLIDAGYDYPPTYEAWEAGARAVGCDLARDVARIVVTHFHPDHLGAARQLSQLSGAPVSMLEEEIPHARGVWESGPGPERFVGSLVRHGMDRSLAEKAAAGTRASLTLPGELHPLRPGEELPLGDGSARVVHAPGHADYQLILHDEDRGILYAADHVLLKITPNVGLWPESVPHPLARYLKSLETLRDLGVDLVLPGHGPVFHDLDGRIDELAAHHAERLDAMHAVLRDGPKTAYDVSTEVFRGDLTLYEQCFALAETLAHLEHLSLQHRAERLDTGTVTYRAT